MSEHTNIPGPKGDMRVFPVADPKRQTVKRVDFHSGVTYIRPNGGVPGQIHLQGAGYLTLGVAEQLISALAGACTRARADQAIGSMGTGDGTEDNPSAVRGHSIDVVIHDEVHRT